MKKLLFDDGFEALKKLTEENYYMYRTNKLLYSHVEFDNELFVDAVGGPTTRDKYVPHLHDVGQFLVLAACRRFFPLLSQAHVFGYMPDCWVSHYNPRVD